MINTNGNGFIAVVIQYRLGAFGFLSSEDVKKNGQVNAGLLDQRFALRWVQAHIRSFGGDPSKVTIAGESAGAGAVMLQALAYGGKQNPPLFNNVRLHLAKKRLPSNTSPRSSRQAFMWQSSTSIMTRFRPSTTKRLPKLPVAVAAQVLLFSTVW